MLRLRPPAEHEYPTFIEFVAIIAACMSLNALAINAMMPAFSLIGQHYKVTDHNQLQWVITLFFAGNGVGQLVFGIASDWLGRRRVILWGLIAYTFLSIAAAFAPSLGILIFIRFFHGLSAASSQVVARAVVRDLYRGERMAMVMSSAFMVFILVPTIAPFVGSLIIMVLPWQFIFVFLGFFGIGVALWAYLALPETRPTPLQIRPSVHTLYVAFSHILRQKTSVFYGLATALMLSTLMSFISLTPQIFAQVFKNTALMTPIFALTSLGMGATSLLNAKMVERLGMRRISHASISLFFALSLIHMAYAALGHESMIGFALIETVLLALMSLSTSNFSAIAMESVGNYAGTAASFQGIVTTLGGAVIAAIIGQFWHNSLILLPISTAVCSALALLCIAFAEGGKLYDLKRTAGAQSS